MSSRTTPPPADSAPRRPSSAGQGPASGQTLAADPLPSPIAPREASASASPAETSARPAQVSPAPGPERHASPAPAAPAAQETPAPAPILHDLLPLPAVMPNDTGIDPHAPGGGAASIPGETTPLTPDDEGDMKGAGSTRSQWELIQRRFAKHKLAVISLYVLVALYTMGLFAEFFAPYSSTWKDVNMIFAPPQSIRFSMADGFYTDKLERKIEPITQQNYFIRTGEKVPLGFFVKGEPYHMWGFIPMETRFFGVADFEKAHAQSGHTFFLLGADGFGRDLWSRLCYGGRISLSIGLVSIVVTFVLGAIVGGISGYMGGSVDGFIQRFIEVINSLPNLPLWLALANVMPASWGPVQTYFAITVVLSLLNWTGLARVVRGKILSLRDEDYAVAARLLGASDSRILFVHLLPGFSSHIIVSLTMSVPGMILGETALSFLGLGLRPPVVSWGVMLQDCFNLDIVANYPWLLMPVVMIVVTVLAFNFLGDGMRDAADPYASR